MVMDITAGFQIKWDDKDNSGAKKTEAYLGWAWLAEYDQVTQTAQSWEVSLIGMTRDSSSAVFADI